MPGVGPTTFNSNFFRALSRTLLLHRHFYRSPGLHRGAIGFCAMLALYLAAMAQLSTSILTGSVVDDSGAAIAGASVTITPIYQLGTPRSIQLAIKLKF